MTLKRKIFLILGENRSLSTYPSVYNAITLLQQQDFQTTLFLPHNAPVGCNLSGARVVRFFCFPRLTWPMLFLKLFGYIKREDWVFAIDIHSLIICGLFQQIVKCRVVYYCLEIYDGTNNSAVDRLKKKLEGYYNRKARYTIVQDETRKELLCSLNSVNQNTVLCVPNSYLGIMDKKSTYLRDKFSIPASTNIVLYAGGIEAWALDGELLNSVNYWPSDLILVLHGWSRDGFIDTVKTDIAEINRTQCKVILSLGLLSESEYSQMVSSADIGLVWYKRDIPPNVRSIGLSSGKFAMFLRCGIPIVLPSYMEGCSEYVIRDEIGKTCMDEDGIAGAAGLILSNYQNYRKNALAFFCEYMDFGKSFSKIIDLINVS